MHHVLDAGVVIKAIGRQVLAIAGVLEASVRHLCRQRDVGVDPDRAEVKMLGKAHGTGVVVGPHRRGQAVLDVIGPGQSLLISAKALDSQNRTKDFILDVLVGLD